MDDDNLYPLDGAAFTEALPEQHDEAKLEVAKAQAARPMLEDIIARFNQKIDFYDSVDSIQVDITADPATFQKVHAANKLTRDNLISEVEWLEGLLDDQR